MKVHTVRGKSGSNRDVIAAAQREYHRLTIQIGVNREKVRILEAAVKILEESRWDSCHSSRSDADIHDRFPHRKEFTL